MFSIHADKAPGPDGFSASFFHSNWDSTGKEIAEEIQAFFTTGSLPGRLNKTFIRLIPKIQNPNALADYRPIALCNVYYKIISKLLSKCLHPLLPFLISENQSAFVAGREISDNVLDNPRSTTLFEDVRSWEKGVYGGENWYEYSLWHIRVGFLLSKFFGG